MITRAILIYYTAKNKYQPLSEAVIGINTAPDMVAINVKDHNVPGPTCLSISGHKLKISRKILLNENPRHTDQLVESV